MRISSDLSIFFSFWPVLLNHLVQPIHIFVPFASGSRKCIGDRLAFLELKIIIKELVKNFDIKKISCENIKTNPFVTLRPTNKIIVKTNYLKE